MLIEVPRFCPGKVSTASGATRKGASSMFVSMKAAALQNWLLARAKHVLCLGGGTRNVPCFHEHGDTRLYFNGTTNTQGVAFIALVDTAPHAGAGSITITPDSGGGAAVTYRINDDVGDWYVGRLATIKAPIAATGSQYLKVEWTNATIMTFALVEWPRSKLDTAADTCSQYLGTGHAGLMHDRHITDSTTAGPRSLVVGAQNAKSATKRTHIPLIGDDSTYWNYPITVADTWEEIGNLCLGLSTSWAGWQMRQPYFRASDTTLTVTPQVRARRTGAGTAYLQFTSSKTSCAVATLALSSSFGWQTLAALSCSSESTDSILPEALSDDAADSIQIASVQFVPT